MRTLKKNNHDAKLIDVSRRNLAQCFDDAADSVRPGCGTYRMDIDPSGNEGGGDKQAHHEFAADALENARLIEAYDISAPPQVLGGAEVPAEVSDGGFWANMQMLCNRQATRCGAWQPFWTGNSARGTRKGPTARPSRTRRQCRAESPTFLERGCQFGIGQSVRPVAIMWLQSAAAEPCARVAGPARSEPCRQG